MERQIVDYTDYADIINKALKEGIFLTIMTTGEAGGWVCFKNCVN